MTDAFYLAAIPDSWEILGVKLRPFSLGHVILLHRINSPFVVESKTINFDDIALAVLICSEDYKTGNSLLVDTSLPKILRKWADSLTGMNRWSVRIGWNSAKVIEFNQVATEFYSYVREHSKIPNYDFNPSDFRQLDCPEVQLVKVTLMKEMVFNEAELLDRGWGLCLWDYVTIRAIDGKVKMISDESRNEALNIANRLLAKIQSGEVTVKN